MEPEAKTQPARRWLVPALLVIVILLLVVVIIFLMKPGGTIENDTSSETTAGTEEGTLKLGYAQGVTVVDDESALQDAVNKMFEDAQNEMVASYKGQATSEDGKTFACYIANSDYNEYDMFIALYMDMGSDPLFLSGLMRPGEAFREITLDEALDQGAHTVYLAFTQVEDDHETIHGQSVVTIEMVVN